VKVRRLLVILYIIIFQQVFGQFFDNSLCETAGDSFSISSTRQGIFKPGKTGPGEYFRVLIAFAQFKSDVQEDPSGIWPLDTLPVWADNFIHDTVLPDYDQNTLSDYFDEASRCMFSGTHVFDFIGDVYPKLIILPNDKEYGPANLDVIKELNANIPDFKRYDNWNCKGTSFIFSERNGDGLMDMLIIIYRNPPPGFQFKLSGGIASLNLSKDFITHDGVILKRGYSPSKERGGITSVNKLAPKFNFITHIAHEYGHYLLSSAHTLQGGLMSGDVSPQSSTYYGGTYMMNGWERERLGYINYIIPTADGQEIKLRDFVQSGDVLKIPVPFYNPLSTTFFLVENHQRLSLYDQINKGGEFKGSYNSSRVGSGIYIWLVTNSTALAPGMDIKTADGSWDWVLDGTITMPPGMPATMPLSKRSAVNRHTGKSDRHVDNILWNNCWWNKWHDNVEDDISNPPKREYVFSRDVFGDGKDAFNLGYNELFTPWSNPSSYAGGTSDISLQLISKNETEYTVKVYSTSKSAEELLPPSKPQDFKVLANSVLSNFHPKLIWNANEEPDVVRAEEGYNIERKINNGAFIPIAAMKGSSSEFIDSEINLSANSTGIISYRILAKDTYGHTSLYSNIKTISYGDIRGVSADNDQIILDYQLHQNYPNPFNPSTTISYELPSAGPVQLKVFDTMGAEVAVLSDNYKSRGRYSVNFDGSSLPSGIYILSLRTKDITLQRKMILLK